MRQIKPALAALIAASVLLIAPAAQARSTPNRAEAIRNQIEQLQRNVNRNDNRDRISEREASGLRRDVASLQSQFRLFNRNGLSNGEMRTLESRINAIRGRLHVERRDTDHRRM